ncbi:MAG: glycosyltransferase family 4 protein, partial [Saprospiraceae bacterium]|nr:glycosyltransferase family 4 protein [Saprospiraceae bacterium]
PVSILEAMALGLVVVSTDVGGMPQLIEHGVTGMLSPSENIEVMVNNLEHILQTPSVAATLQKNARTKAEMFDWKAIEPRWINLIDRTP